MLEISNLSVSIEKKHILNQVDLAIGPGELHVLMGPNGSGKSSLAMTLAGHPAYVVDSGNIALDGHGLLRLPVHERAKQGLFVSFQNPLEFEGISVQNFLKVAYENTHRKLTSIVEFRKSLQEKAQQFGLNPEFLQRSLNNGFSGGEKKKMEMFQLAVLKPKYAILDEIDSGMDVDAVHKLAEHVKILQKKLNVGVLLITHYPNMLKVLHPEKVHVMIKGKIVESGGNEFAQKLEKQGFSAYL